MTVATVEHRQRHVWKKCLNVEKANAFSTTRRDRVKRKLWSSCLKEQGYNRSDASSPIGEHNITIRKLKVNPVQHFAQVRMGKEPSI